MCLRVSSDCLPFRHAGFGENYGVQIVEGPLAGMFSRAVVVLDENNTVVHREHIDDIARNPIIAPRFARLELRSMNNKLDSNSDL